MRKKLFLSLFFLSIFIGLLFTGCGEPKLVPHYPGTDGSHMSNSQKNEVDPQYQYKN